MLIEVDQFQGTVHLWLVEARTSISGAHSVSGVTSGAFCKCLQGSNNTYGLVCAESSARVDGADTRCRKQVIRGPLEREVARPLEQGDVRGACIGPIRRLERKPA